MAEVYASIAKKKVVKQAVIFGLHMLSTTFLDASLIIRLLYEKGNIAIKNNMIYIYIHIIHVYLCHTKINFVSIDF